MRRADADQVRFVRETAPEMGVVELLDKVLAEPDEIDA